jgi:hypothetical protein
MWRAESLQIYTSLSVILQRQSSEVYLVSFFKAEAIYHPLLNVSEYFLMY